jgi:hypothetical protein
MLIRSATRIGKINLRIMQPDLYLHFVTTYRMEKINLALISGRFGTRPNKNATQARRPDFVSIA